MMTTGTIETDALEPSQAEAEAAERLGRALARQLAKGGSAVILADKSTGNGEALPAAEEHRLSLKIPPKTQDEYLDTLRKQGLPQTAERLIECWR